MSILPENEKQLKLISKLTANPDVIFVVNQYFEIKISLEYNLKTFSLMF